MENIYKAKLELIASIERMRFTNLDEENFEKETRQKKSIQKRRLF